ncbi:hypothetical protein T440DRAFT_466141 [Plenodomus tracheiphilus IPT5]|uniref:Uncharacterized protein n=1 Tax=Plenodomus tracheiphilus IPT5 TaxID=1408161 RepID=A0A6A7BCS6_9PLEO|nr:hypothetical protein T440DRAFT_466141 [Plenodomus tracheiphilus IPT5]
MQIKVTKNAQHCTNGSRASVSATPALYPRFTHSTGAMSADLVPDKSPASPHTAPCCSGRSSAQPGTLLQVQPHSPLSQSRRGQHVIDYIGGEEAGCAATLAYFTRVADHLRPGRMLVERRWACISLFLVAARRVPRTIPGVLAAMAKESRPTLVQVAAATLQSCIAISVYRACQRIHASAQRIRGFLCYQWMGWRTLDQHDIWYGPELSNLTPGFDI